MMLQILIKEINKSKGYGNKAFSIKVRDPSYTLHKQITNHSPQTSVCPFLLLQPQFYLIMSYHDSKSKTNLAMIGADAFALLDDLSGGHKSKPKPSLSKVSVPPRRTPNKLFHYQYQPEEAYVIRQQEMRTETVLDCYEAAKRYGGTVTVDYPKRKPVLKGFFY
ncbi:hypothetical protein L6452_25695 [Arctium lappa]|uniref:Uncharacterized protein n=1 Tax=Arctium lappa TaxID=4217 RepID=A0ACB9ABI7_ARCLA|nr:hypothetical protein L6452_25695 [Arctium lappa]